MTLVRLLLVIEPRSATSAVPFDDVLDDICGSGGVVETTNDRGQISFIAIATWSDWRGLAEWWSSARARADAAGLTVRGLLLDRPIGDHGRAARTAAPNLDPWFDEFSTGSGSPGLEVAGAAKCHESW